ncbi:unnamed protein product [Cuscuta campestris]|uniref:CCHC-type domain-containing protein n=1 Tax=Cuscuta campestris TaxID=132261 RepID=A0A484MN05_9ASTE|nr:unnamed protein product [Cuscuta campestris]
MNNTASALVQVAFEGVTISLVVTLRANSAHVMSMGLSPIPTPSMAAPFAVPVPFAGLRVTFPQSMTQFLNDPANLQVVSVVAPINLTGALNVAGLSRPPQSARHPRALLRIIASPLRVMTRKSAKLRLGQNVAHFSAFARLGEGREADPARTQRSGSNRQEPTRSRVSRQEEEAESQPREPVRIRLTHLGDCVQQMEAKLERLEKKVAWGEEGPGKTPCWFSVHCEGPPDTIPAEGQGGCPKEYAGIFAWSVTDVPGIDRSVICHQLAVREGSRLVRQKKRYLASDRRDFVQKEVKDLLSVGHIREVKYPDSLVNVVLAPKGDTWRMCVDYMDLNKACAMDSYPLASRDQMVDETARCELLSFMNAFKGYHQIYMAKEDEEKTSFLMPEGTYCYQVSIKSDSSLIVGQVAGNMEAREGRLAQYLVLALLKGFVEFNIAQIHRPAENADADLLSKLTQSTPEHVSIISWDYWVRKVKLRAPRFQVIDGMLYKRPFEGPLLRASYYWDTTGQQSSKIVDGLKILLGEAGNKWLEELPHIIWAYRVTPRKAHGETPFSLTYGCEARLPIEAKLPTFREANYQPQQNEEDHLAELNLVEERRMASEKVGEKLVPKTEDEFDAEDIKKVENYDKAINMLYCAVNPVDYRKISCCTTAKEMWDKLEVTYEEDLHQQGFHKASKETVEEVSSDDDNEFGLVSKKFHKFMKKEFERKGRKHDGPLKCYGCGEIGHIKPRCPKGKSGKDKPSFKKQRAYISWGGDSGDESTDQEEDEAANLCLMAHKDHADEVQDVCLKASSVLWYLDSGCSKHLTGDASKFIQIKPAKGGNVVFGDNSKGKIIGISSVDSLERIHVEDDEENTGIYINTQPQIGETPQATNQDKSRAGTSGKSKSKSRAPTTSPEERLYYGDGSYLLLDSEEGRTRFLTIFSKRVVAPPRIVPERLLELQGYDDLNVQLHQTGLWPFVSRDQKEINPALIRAFYLNLRREDDVIYSLVKSTPIELTVEQLGRIAGLPYQGDDISLYGGEDWVLNKYIKLLHAIMHSTPFNWAKFVMINMTIAASTAHDHLLLYPFVVMDILEWFKVTTTVGPLTKATKLWTISGQTFTKRSDNAAPATAAPRRTATATGPAEPQARANLASITDSLNRLHFKFDGMDGYLERLDEAVQRQGHAMNAYFQRVNYVPPTVPWQVPWGSVR